MAALCACACLGSCTSGGPAAADGDPETHVVAFGSLCVDGMLQDGAVSDIVFARTDPAAPPARLEPYRRGSMFFTDPLPVGESWRLESFSLGDGTVVAVPAAPGLPGPLPAFCLEKPGLLFLGSCAVEAGSGALRVRAFPSEEELLRDLRDAYRGTPWENVAESRINSRH